MLSLLKQPSIEYVAQGVASDLLRHIQKQNGEWDPLMWASIFGRIQREGDYMGEAGPCSVLIYQRYVRIAVVHLAKFPNAVAQCRLIARIRSDMRSLAYHRRCMRRDVFTDLEHQLMSDAVDDIYSRLEILERC